MLAQSSSILSIAVAPIMCEMAISRPGGMGEGRKVLIDES